MRSNKEQGTEKGNNQNVRSKPGASTKASELSLHTDGAARGNPGPAGAGGVIFDQHGRTVAKISEYVGEATNNVAEYTALIITLEEAKKYRVRKVKIYSDSELLVNQLGGKYKIKNQAIKPLVDRARFLLSSYEEVDFFHVPREENAGADRLANQAIEDYKKGKKPRRKLQDISEQEKLF